VEPTVDEAALASFPTSSFFPEASRQAWFGLPHIIVWQAVKR
jgi:hypothetical protein